MELADDCDESARAAEFLHDLPEAFPADCIEGLGQVNEGRVGVAMLFHALLLELTSSKDHVTGPTNKSFSTKMCLILGYVSPEYNFDCKARTVCETQ